MAQTSLNSTGVASSGALSLQSNGTTEAIGISTGQVATFAQNPILTSGTANGVAYLNGSKVVTSGSALVFDGTNLGLGVTPSAWATGWKPVQMGSWGGFVAGRDSFSQLWTGANNYYNGTNWIYKATDYASQYYQADGAHVWRTAASGTAGNAITFTQAMTLDASGNLGIGNTSPTVPLSFANSAGTAGTANKISLFWTAGESFGLYGFGVSAAQLDYVTGGAHVFYSRSTNTSTERARIDSSGNLLVGTTSTGLKTNRSMGFLVNGGCVQYMSHSTSDASGDSYIEFGYNGTKIGSITQSGTTAVAYNTSSDYRLKNSIAPMTGALAKVALLKPCTYRWNADDSDGEGFIAHELAEVCPNAVTGEKDAVDADGNPKYQGIDTSFLVATLTAAIQEQQAIITSLTARIEALEA